jgi:PHD/YefM family antitoxin component YafN of YafNO toxin-antitoxin module
MAAKKRAKQQKSRAESRAKSRTKSGRDGAKLKSAARPKQKQKQQPKSGAKRGRPSKADIPDGARALPLAALRAALGTEIDRVRRHGGYTLILRRGKPVAAVIPFEEFRRYRMTGRFEEHERAQRGAQLIADIRRVREAIAKQWRERGRPPDADLTAAEFINKLRDERTQQILDASSGRQSEDRSEHDDQSGGRG